MHACVRDVRGVGARFEDEQANTLNALASTTLAARPYYCTSRRVAVAISSLTTLPLFSDPCGRGGSAAPSVTVRTEQCRDVSVRMVARSSIVDRIETSNAVDRRGKRTSSTFNSNFLRLVHEGRSAHSDGRHLKFFHSKVRVCLPGV